MQQTFCRFSLLYTRRDKQQLPLFFHEFLIRRASEMVIHSLLTVLFSLETESTGGLL